MAKVTSVNDVMWARCHLANNYRTNEYGELEAFNPLMGWVPGRKDLAYQKLLATALHRPVTFHGRTPALYETRS